VLSKDNAFSFLLSKELLSTYNTASLARSGRTDLWRFMAR